ncbi:Hypothetical Protein RradSPS_1087 [Rubrobacter radiotolerans]|uniref:Uncharacterized protein n=1 Tax=Rubrobacter radiotolerans TaxID=42256 RepID=A0A023X2Y7_RUBRA|nr:hypothetical protein [Rubrobacter radiotolerans]AHY46370.1 Hypothetical Protein RradSPS_1087 [Rubrobacter radiotolerans]MDX5893777.1 hypothetical protein [Rubrobacter radiotolerans]SMC04483.1 hypothetical protein SAMN00767673_1082 [Rubrobacter radiotolerans DSM 5868]
MTQGPHERDRIDAVPDRELSPAFLPPETVRERLKQIPGRVLSGREPEAFAQTMCVDFAYGERRFFAEDSGRGEGMAILLLRDDLPEALRAGFGPYEAATLYTRGGPPEVVLHRVALLAGIA